MNYLWGGGLTQLLLRPDSADTQALFRYSMGAVNFLEGKAPLVRLATATLATVQIFQRHAVQEDATNRPRPLQVDNIFVFIRQMAGLFRHVGYLRHQQQPLTF